MKLILSSRDFLNDNSRKVIMDNLPKKYKSLKFYLYLMRRQMMKI